jgi:hypothetical protein
MSDKSNNNKNESNDNELKYLEFSTDSLHNNYINNPYNNAPNQNDFMELSRHREICNLLENIRDNTITQINQNRDGIFTNFSAVFLVGLFILYMIFGFYQGDGFSYPLLCKLFGMIISLFLLVIILHRHEVNVLNKFNKN